MGIETKLAELSNHVARRDASAESAAPGAATGVPVEVTSGFAGRSGLGDMPSGDAAKAEETDIWAETGRDPRKGSESSPEAAEPDWRTAAHEMHNFRSKRNIDCYTELFDVKDIDKLPSNKG